MGTRGHIIFEQPEGGYAIRHLYSDSYIAHGVGQALVENYNTIERVTQLFNCGMNFSSIIETVERYEERVNLKMVDRENHNVIGNCIVKTSEPVTIENCQTLEEALRECPEEYVYIYSPDKGWQINLCDDNISLAQVLPLSILADDIGTLEYRYNQKYDESIENLVARMEKSHELVGMLKGEYMDDYIECINKTSSLEGVDSIYNYEKQYQRWILAEKLEDQLTLNHTVQSKKNKI